MPRGRCVAPDGWRWRRDHQGGNWYAVSQCDEYVRRRHRRQTGEAEVADTAALTNASLIRVQSGGTLDVTDFAAGYALNGQELTTAGQVEGSIHATNGSTVTALRRSSVITGNLTRG